METVVTADAVVVVGADVGAVVVEDVVQISIAGIQMLYHIIEQLEILMKQKI